VCIFVRFKFAQWQGKWSNLIKFSFGVGEKYSAAYGGGIRFSKTPILLVLLRKTNKIGVLEK
jgi:hypothetical protein